jgi:PAS domain S-box-containing protein
MLRAWQLAGEPKAEAEISIWPVVPPYREATAMKVQAELRPTLDRSVIIGIGLVIALQAVGTSIIYRNIHSLNVNSSWVAHTYEVDRIAADVFREATDLAVFQQGYLLSQDDDFLEAYRKSSELLPESIEQLRQVTVDRVSQQQRVAGLERLIASLREELDGGIDDIRNGVNRGEATSAVFVTKDRLQKIREAVGDIRREEQRLLSAREREVRRTLLFALGSALGHLILGLCLLTGVIVLIRRNVSAAEQQQASLFAEREQLDVTLSSIADAVLTVDAGHRVLQWNLAATTLTGLPAEDARGRLLEDVLILRDEITREPVALPVGLVIASGQPQGLKEPVLLGRGDGVEQAVLVRCTPVRDRMGDVTGVVLVLNPRLAEQQAEQARLERTRLIALRADVGMLITRGGQTDLQLEQCVQKVHSQLPALGVGLWVINVSSSQLELRAGATSGGWKLPEHVGRDASNSVLARAVSHQNKLQSRIEADDIQIIGAARQGDSTPEFVAAYPLQIEDRLIGVLAVYGASSLSELTFTELELLAAKLSQFIERRRIEEARNQSEELFRTLSNSIPQLAWMARPDGYIFWYNERWFDYTGTTFEQMSGWGWQSVHDPRELPHVVESLNHSFATGEPWEDTFPIRRHDGEFRWHLSRMLPVRDEHGRIRLWFGTNTDITEQREAEQRVRESEGRLRRVIDSVLAFVGILSPDGTLIEANRAPLIAAGLSRDDVIGEKFWDCQWWSDSDETRQQLRKDFERAISGEVIRHDVEMRVSEDERLTIDLMMQPVFEEDRLLFVIPSGVDITDRKRFEQELAASWEFLRSSLDGLSSQIAVVDESGVILAVNQAWREFANANGLGLTDHGVGQSYLDVCIPELTDDRTDVETPVAGILGVLEGRAPSFTMEYPRHFGTAERWFQIRANRYETGDSVRVVISHEDITSRVQTEESTRLWSEQQQGLATLAGNLSAAQDVLEILDVVTAGARELLQARAAETRRLRDVSQTVDLRATDDVETDDVSPIRSTEWDVLRERVCRTNRPIRLTSESDPASTLTEANLKLLDVDPGGWLAAPLIGHDGRNMGLIELQDKLSGPFTSDDEAILVQLAQMASVSLERARLHEEIRESDRRKDQFLALLAHELRNPLSALTSGTQLIALRPNDAMQVAETADLILRQCGQLKQLVDDLLDVSRISRGKLHLQLTRCCLQAILRQAVETASPLCEASNHELIVRLPEELLHVTGDAVRLAQVVSNLLINAAKYTSPGGRVELILVAEQGEGIITVKDNGIGIPAEKMDEIFELFAQVDASHTRSQGGLGIGLTLAKTLVDLHQGQISVSSEGMNRGSTFTVRLPLLEVPLDVESSNAVSREPSDTPVPRRILVVDDNRAAVHLLEKLLRSLGQTVETAGDGGSALSAISIFQPELVISDIGMPDMSGYELARRIREQANTARPVLVALTGYGQETDRAAALEAGFDEHLTKPVSLDQLVALLQWHSTFRQQFRVTRQTSTNG